MFFVNVCKSQGSKFGLRVELKFTITQHSRDGLLMQSLINSLGCGKYRVRLGQSVGDLTVSKFSDITDKIIPFFYKYPLYGVKAKKTLCWRIFVKYLN